MLRSAIRWLACLGLVATVASSSGGAPTAAVREATPIVVTATSFDRDGDVASPAALLANPGPDGTISLAEAITAANNEPGTYAIRFAPKLAGRTIVFARRDAPEVLRGDGVSIDGDINGDGRPDVTVAGGPGKARLPEAFVIASSGNRLHALRVRGFDRAIGLAGSGDEPPPGTTYTGNEISGLVMTDVSDGIALEPARGGQPRSCLRHACAGHARWLDTTITGNTIDATFSGITFQLANTVDDTVQRLTISHNTIRLATQGGETTSGFAVILESGLYGGSDGNRIADATVSGNTIAGNPQGGIRLASGGDGGSRNTLERIHVTGNRFDVHPALAGTVSRPLTRYSIDINVGDACNTFYAPKERPVRCPHGNLARDIEISGNTLAKSGGVSASSGNCGANGNTLRDLRILRNTIVVRIVGLPTSAAAKAGEIRGIMLTAGTGNSPPCSTQTSANRSRDVSIVGNRISVEPGLVAPEYGIVLFGGWLPGATRNRLTCIHLRDNRITGFRTAPLLLRDDADGGAGNTASRSCS